MSSERKRRRSRRHRGRKRSTSTRRKERLLLGVAVAVASLPVWWVLFSLTGEGSAEKRPGKVSLVNERLFALPANRWKKLYQDRSGRWRRQLHASAVFDTRRRKLFIFGSDTHGRNLDNRIHEFDPITLQWSVHYPAAPRSSYRVDEQGHPVAGEHATEPWAMHVYDGMIYDPKSEELLVSARPDHNPAIRFVEGGGRHPVWRYDLKEHRWQTMDVSEAGGPPFFDSASAYDSNRDVIAVYAKKGLWELGPDRQKWVPVSDEVHHHGHSTMVFDKIRKMFAVFGDREGADGIWFYRPGANPDEPGKWFEKKPSGEGCEAMHQVPVAFEAREGVFVFLRNWPDKRQGKQEASAEAEPSAATFFYDPDSNRCSRIEGAELAPMEMNYMLTYDPFYKVLFLVTGDWQQPLTVWALRLDRAELGGRAAPVD